MGNVLFCDEQPRHHLALSFLFNVKMLYTVRVYF